MAAAAPSGWRRLRLDYRAVGRHVEADFVITGPDGTPGPAAPPSVAVTLLGRMRAEMYRPGHGTWVAASVVVDPGAPPWADYLHDREPAWRRPPPPVGFADELRFFPRSEGNVPHWLRLRAGPDPAPVADERARSGAATASGPSADTVLRTPRVFDGLDDAGAPVLDRAPLEEAERDRVLNYLAAAPVVLAARGHDSDVLDPDRPPSVPLTFRTDGFWVWPGAVAYYLREHDVAPDPEFLTHLRARDYTVPEVDEPTRERAVAAVTAPAE